jgi:hypothetical protein
LAANAADAPKASDKQIAVNIVFIKKLSYLANNLATLPTGIAPIDRMSRSARRWHPSWRSNKRAIEKVQRERPAKMAAEAHLRRKRSWRLANQIMAMVFCLVSKSRPKASKPGRRRHVTAKEYQLRRRADA